MQRYRDWIVKLCFGDGAQPKSSKHNLIMSPKRRLRSSSHEAAEANEVRRLSKSPSKNAAERPLEDKVRLNLKRLGITNVVEHLKTTSLEEKVSGSRKTRSSVNPTTETTLINLNTAPKLSEESASSNATRTTPGKGSPGAPTAPKTTRKYQKRQTLSLNKESALSTLLMASKSSRKRNAETEQAEADEQTPKRNQRGRPSKAAKRSKVVEVVEAVNGHLETESEDSQLQSDGCKVPGCDSKGHLSGAFPTHSILDTCPVYHNQTPEECVQRYRKRTKASQKRSSSLSPSKSRKSPSKSPVKSPSKKGTRINLENDPSWNALMEERKAELLDTSLNEASEVMSTITTR